MSLSEGLATLEGIHLQLTSANLVCPNVQISGIDTSNINNITLQVTSPSLAKCRQLFVFISELSDLNPCDSVGPCPQIAPAILQQTLQQGGLLSHSLTSDAGLTSHLASGDPGGLPANVVLQPLTSLALQPSSMAPSGTTMGGLGEPDGSGRTRHHTAWPS